MEKKEIYCGSAVIKKTPLQTAFSLIFVVIFCMVMFWAGSFFKFSWAFEIGAIVISAVIINKILNQGTFTKTYVLYEDCLIEITRYGLIEKETGVYFLKNSVFTENSVTCEGKTKPFYPDKKLMELLK